MSHKIFRNSTPFQLENGKILPGYHLAYTTIGELNASRDNVVWVFHALTANSDASEWWPGLVGEGKIFDPLKYFVVCVNMPGSCYGSIGPLEIDGETNEPFYHEFSFFTTRDMIRAYQPLRIFLGIEKIRIGIGGSMGGQQLLEWAIAEPALFAYIVPLATNAVHSPWAVAFNSSQRFCIEADPSWKESDPMAGVEGMKVARSIALLSYRNYVTYQLSQTHDEDERIEGFKSESYQRYQGEKLAKRFNAFSYYILSKSMDSHNVGRGRGSVEAALALIEAKTLVISIETDILFPAIDQELLARQIPGASLASISSVYGHDGFLLEYAQIGSLIRNFIEEEENHTPIQKVLHANR